jgi:hypothetical protein
MKKARVSAVLRTAILGSAVLMAGCMFAAKTKYKQGEALKYIEGHPTLSQEWADFKIKETATSLVTMEAMPGMLQAGASFYAKYQYDPGELAMLEASWQDRPHTQTVSSLPRFGLRVNGTKYLFWTNQSDGPVSFAIVDKTVSNTVYYCGYGGDGS